ncbi:EthD family reductase [uncultured Sphingomonas sp.]|uniref:EthD family reductase n=1 Tax=uncultured Sphingomonas sp. TaxID=158754 RepID=UPI0025D94612|nr:EthD family reductase [uncultured Sphingomonas sp.]
MGVLVVSYPAEAGSRFDADYYLATHMPLAERYWRESGMTGARPLIGGAGPAGRLAAMVLIDFAPGTDIGAVMAAPASAPVFADVANFTDIAPVAHIFLDA